MMLLIQVKAHSLGHLATWPLTFTDTTFSYPKEDIVYNDHDSIYFNRLIYIKRRLQCTGWGNILLMYQYIFFLLCIIISLVHQLQGHIKSRLDMQYQRIDSELKTIGRLLLNIVSLPPRTPLLLLLVLLLEEVVVHGEDGSLREVLLHRSGQPLQLEI